MRKTRKPRYCFSIEFASESAEQQRRWFDNALLGDQLSSLACDSCFDLVTVDVCEVTVAVIRSLFHGRRRHLRRRCEKTEADDVCARILPLIDPAQANFVCRAE
jgi:hypothetical protein